MKSTPVKPKPSYSRAEKNSKQWFADLYGIDKKTFIVWLRRNPPVAHLADDDRKIYTPAESSLIRSVLG